MVSELEKQLDEVRTQYPLVGQHIEYLEERAKLAVIDSVTGLFSRRFFDEILTKELAEARRTKTPISLLMLDLDYFKQYNDRYGHPAGDVLLGKTGEIIRTNTREMDYAFRYGGEEFVIIQKYIKTKSQHERRSSPRKIAMRVATEILEEFRNQMPLTISIGTTTSLGYSTAEDLVSYSDKALYRAKEKRNCIRQHPGYLP